MIGADVRSGPRRWLDRPLVENAVALYGLNASAYLFPIVTAPYVARVLHPDGWGRVAIAQSLGQSLAVIVEYGFALSATRAVASAAAAERGVILGTVVGAKLVLAAVAIVVAGLAVPWIPALADQRRLVVAAVFWAAAQGLHPLWYYQGRERLRTLVVMDVAATVFAIGGVFALCRTPADAWKVLAVQAAGVSAVVVAGYGLATREVGAWRPTWRAIGARLRAGAALFAYRAAVTLYTVANALVLGFLAPAAAVGYFAGAEKIVKALFLAGINPLNQALYPRASRLAGRGGAAKHEAVAGALPLFVALGGLSGAAVLIMAPWLVRIVFGPGYESAVAPLRILALLLPLLATSSGVVMQRMLPAARDRVLVAVTLAAGVLNVALATVLVPRLGAVGMAVSVVVTETVVMVSVLALARRSTPR
jgi:PST family polysaccharide transporter